MTDLLSITIGCLVATGVYLMLSFHLMRVIFGIMLLGNAINLSILLLGRLNSLKPAFVGINMPVNVSNALAQALILTSIVISFGLCLFCFLMAKKGWERYKTLNIQATQWRKE